MTKTERDELAALRARVAMLEELLFYHVRYNTDRIVPRVYRFNPDVSFDHPGIEELKCYREWVQEQTMKGVDIK